MTSEKLGFWNFFSATISTLGIPTLTLLDSNCDPTLSTYGITANDDSTRSVEIILESLIAN